MKLLGGTAARMDGEFPLPLGLAAALAAVLSNMLRARDEHRLTRSRGFYAVFAGTRLGRDQPLMQLDGRWSSDET
jgi:hypothetical protein